MKKMQHRNATQIWTNRHTDKTPIKCPFAILFWFATCILFNQTNTTFFFHIVPCIKYLNHPKSYPTFPIFFLHLFYQPPKKNYQQNVQQFIFISSLRPCQLHPSGPQSNVSFQLRNGQLLPMCG